MPSRHDAIVVGAGPNGLAAAIALARAGRSVRLVEAKPTIGGGGRSAALTLPGFIHDVCAAIHPMARASAFLRTLPLADYGLVWKNPELPVAHPLDGGRCAVLEPDVAATAERLGADGDAYRTLLTPLVAGGTDLLDDVLGPVRVPRHPLALARFGVHAVRSAAALARRFETNEARALMAGLAAHAILPLARPATAAFALLFAATAHIVGWPCARGGTQRLVDAMAAYFRGLGGEIVTDCAVRTTPSAADARAVLFDVTPRQLVAIAGGDLPSRYVRRLARYRYGPGVFKIDLALGAPIPWTAEECGRAGTLHVGGTFEEIAAAEAAVARGGHPERPFVLVAQQSLFDPTRAPPGRHTAWAYCHVPNGSTVDMTERIEGQIERFAPGFRDTILARSARDPRGFEQYDENYVGGDIAGGANDVSQLFTRPVASLVPYATPNPRLFLCSSSTPPGAGAHGLCGYFAARAALSRVLRD